MPVVIISVIYLSTKTFTHLVIFERKKYVEPLLVKMNPNIFSGGSPQHVLICQSKCTWTCICDLDIKVITLSEYVLTLFCDWIHFLIVSHGQKFLTSFATFANALVTFTPIDSIIRSLTVTWASYHYLASLLHGSFFCSKSSAMPLWHFCLLQINQQ